VVAIRKLFLQLGRKSMYWKLKYLFCSMLFSIDPIVFFAEKYSTRLIAQRNGGLIIIQVPGSKKN